MSLQQMYPAKNNSPRSFLTAAVAADSTSMTLDDASVLPPITGQNPVNLFVLGTGDDAEIVSYSAINGNVVSGIVRGINGTIAAAWPANTIVARNFTAQDAEAFRQNILDLDERKTDKSYVDTGLAGKSNTSHTHDNRYYTESEVDSALNLKANSASPSFTGTPTIANPSAWLNALGLSDSGWLSHTDASFTGTLYYRKIGNIVSMCGQISVPTDTTANLSLGLTLPVGYRPQVFSTFLCYAANHDYPVQFVVATGGGVSLRRGNNEKIKAGETININVTYFAA